MKKFTPITLADIGATPEQIEILVTGSQKYLPPEDEDETPVDIPDPDPIS